MEYPQVSCDLNPELYDALQRILDGTVWDQSRPVPLFITPPRTQSWHKRTMHSVRFIVGLDRVVWDQPERGICRFNALVLTKRPAFAWQQRWIDRCMDRSVLYCLAQLHEKHNFSRVLTTAEVRELVQERRRRA